MFDRLARFGWLFPTDPTWRIVAVILGLPPLILIVGTGLVILFAEPRYQYFVFLGVLSIALLTVLGEWVYVTVLLSLQKKWRSLRGWGCWVTLFAYCPILGALGGH